MPSSSSPGVFGQVYVHRARQGVGDDERRGGQVVRADVGVDAPFEVAVAREYGRDNEVVLLDGGGDLLGQRTGVPMQVVHP